MLWMYKVYISYILTLLMNKNFNKKHLHVVFVPFVIKLVRVSPSTWKMVVRFVFNCSASLYVNVWIMSSFAINWQQKAHCVEWFINMKLDVQVHNHFWAVYHMMPSSIIGLRVCATKVQGIHICLMKISNMCEVLSVVSASQHVLEHISDTALNSAWGVTKICASVCL
jgi:hypothetical protein